MLDTTDFNNNEAFLNLLFEMFEVNDVDFRHSPEKFVHIDGRTYRHTSNQEMRDWWKLDGSRVRRAFSDAQIKRLLRKMQEHGVISIVNRAGLHIRLNPKEVLELFEKAARDWPTGKGSCRYR